MPKQKKIAIFGTEPVTGKIGGLGIRQLEIARVLSRKYNLTLYTPFSVGTHHEPFPIKRILYSDAKKVQSAVKKSDVIVSCQPRRNITLMAKKLNRPIAVDLFPITYFEEMERMKLVNDPTIHQDIHFASIIEHLSEQLLDADFFFCASERERNFYLGLLTTLGKVTPQIYNKEKHLKKLIDIVPFGLPKRKPKTGKNLIKGKIKGVKKSDFLIVWGGSLWNWYDCLTPIKAMAKLLTGTPKAKLVFVCSTHPATGKPPEEYQRAVRLSKRNGTYNKNVFFYSDWIEHNQRDYYLTEADAGITTFHDHLENYFSFRIRLMDYIWAELPLIANRGNKLAEMLDERGGGVTFDFGNANELAKTIKEMVADKVGVKRMRKNLSTIKKEYHWGKVLKPLIKFIENPFKAERLIRLGSMKLSFYELCRIKMAKVLLFRSSPLPHTIESINAIRTLAPDAKIDILVQNGFSTKKIDKDIKVIKMSNDKFSADRIKELQSLLGKYDTVICPFANKDIEFYRNVIDAMSLIPAKNYLAFGDDYQFNNIKMLCSKKS